MPTLTRWFLRAGMLYLLAALALSVVVAARPTSVPVGLRPTYLHLFFIGWITQLIFGVAHWMFPRASREHPRGREGLGWAAFVLLNAGLLLRAVAEPLAVPGWPLVVSGVSQFAAATVYTLHIWPRIKER